MRIFYDTSAVVPLLLAEERSEVAIEYWREQKEAWAWDWLLIETEAALIRQKADSTAWAAWRNIANNFTCCELSSSRLAELRAFNRRLGLRAADAAHLFLFDRLVNRLPELRLLTFDREMARAAQNLALPLHPGSVSSEEPTL
ncbi:MAG: PIN domain-containing protein [Verrucomicrobia bacterium]|jgi:predicted nucleic acid-binding protein|nr:PIN domain-containing protein [Verrucomicrobiota bacterium]